MTEPTIDQQALFEEAVKLHQAEPHEGLSGARLRIHLTLHVVVETQIAAGDPAFVTEALVRLMALGATRHQAIHGIGRVAASEFKEAVGSKYDSSRYREALERLSLSDCEL